MANLGDMTAYVSKRLQDPGNTAVSVADVQGAINDAIRYWKVRRFWFNEVHDTATLTAQSPAFPYPADFLVPATQDDGFYIEYGGTRYPLGKISQPLYDGAYLANGYGLPRWYARIGNDEYQCWPIPDQDYTVGRHYLKDYDDLASNGEENDFTINAPRMIELWALGDLMSDLRQDLTMADSFYKKAEDQYRQLGVMTNKANASGKLTIYSNLTGGYL